MTTYSIEFLQNFNMPETWSICIDKNKIPSICIKDQKLFNLKFFTKKSLRPKQALSRALDVKSKDSQVLDITAGWAQDAFLISQIPCRVTAIESHPFVFHFTKQSLQQDMKQHKQTHNLKLILANSLDYLNSIKPDQRPDIIYMDPMFSKYDNLDSSQLIKTKKTRSLSQKSLQILQQIVGTESLLKQEELFYLALKLAKKRVIVKRHRLTPCFKAYRFGLFKSRSLCYDVFMPKETRS